MASDDEASRSAKATAKDLVRRLDQVERERFAPRF
jgi:hypothetical protein